MCACACVCQCVREMNMRATKCVDAEISAREKNIVVVPVTLVGMQDACCSGQRQPKRMKCRMCEMNVECLVIENREREGAFGGPAKVNANFILFCFEGTKLFHREL